MELMRLPFLCRLQAAIFPMEFSLQSFTQNTIITCFVLLHTLVCICNLASASHLFTIPKGAYNFEHNCQCSSILRYYMNGRKYKHMKNRKGNMYLPQKGMLCNDFYIPKIFLHYRNIYVHYIWDIYRIWKLMFFL